MSQASGMAGGAAPGSRSANSKATPIFLLALAVAIGAGLLHAIDDSPTATPASLAAATPSVTVTTVAAPVMTTTTMASRPPSQVKVLVLNGTSVAGIAASLNAKLQPAGYVLGKATNTTTPTAQTSVQYAAGYEGEARAVATSLNIDDSMVQAMANPAPVADLQSSNVVVVIGDTLAQSAAATTTSVIGATVTTLNPNATATTSAKATNSAAGTATTKAPATTTTADARAGLNGPLATYQTNN